MRILRSLLIALPLAGCAHQSPKLPDHSLFTQLTDHIATSGINCFNPNVKETTFEYDRKWIKNYIQNVKGFEFSDSLERKYFSILYQDWKDSKNPRKSLGPIEKQAIEAAYQAYKKNTSINDQRLSIQRLSPGIRLDTGCPLTLQEPVYSEKFAFIGSGVGTADYAAAFTYMFQQNESRWELIGSWRDPRVSTHLGGQLMLDEE